ncbi:MAG: alpha/beta hydrolase [Methanobacteriaceae archaeon]|nr:alpha/beta hydrolase [Methanobacteriaceae archaeon]
MNNYEASEILEIIKKQFSIKKDNIDELRRDFERFYLKFSSNQVLELENYCIKHIQFYKITAKNTNPDCAVLFFHGGSFNMGSTRSHLDLCGKLSEASKISVYSPDYRLAPENPFPAPVHDCLDSYLWLVKQGMEPSNIVLAGISAGGTLALSILISLKNKGYELPAGAVCMSPVVDMQFQGAPLLANQEIDWINKDLLEKVSEIYLAGDDPKNPLASPIYADLEDLPPIYLQVGGDEFLRNSIHDFYKKASSFDIDISLEEWSDMFHCWQIFSSYLDEGQEAIDAAGNYIKKILENKKI